MRKFVTFISIFTVLVSADAQNSSKDSLLMFSDPILLEDVEITAGKVLKPITGGMSDILKLDIGNMQDMPQFMGTVDLLRTIQLMPGVQTSGEMNSGVYVRGGDSSHNRFSINGATLYNPSHMLGFFSVFNSTHVNSASIMKSYIPAEYGGQLSSVIDVECEAENVDKVKIDGSIGIISSQLTIASPAGKNGAVKLSGRKTYINALINIFVKDNFRFKPQYDFQDYNFTYTVRPDFKNKITVNGYIGKDILHMNEYYYQASGGSEWMNYAVSANWENCLSDKLKIENNIHTSHYDNNIGVEFGTGEMVMDSKINDFGYKGKADFQIKGVNVNAGIDFTSHNILPQYPGVNTLLGVEGKNNRPGMMRLFVGSVFAEGRFEISDKINSNIGLRYSNVAYVDGENGFYNGIEPKFNLEYIHDANTRYSFSFTTQKQYMNQVMVSGIGMPTDFWLPVSNYIPPQTSYNFSAGFYKSLFDNTLEINTDLYFRKFSNQLEFNGELFNIINETYRIEEHILYGKGCSYGLEFMVKLNKRKFNGWVSYTLGKSDRLFPDINEGKTFPAKNDRRHDLSVAGSYKFNDRWNVSGVFVMATGNAYTMPVAVYIIGDNMVNEYGPYNGSRMPLYHRMDLSATYKFRKKGKVESSINFSLYNCYGRNNPAFVHIKTDISNKENIRIRPVGAALYNVVPSISYIFKY